MQKYVLNVFCFDLYELVFASLGYPAIERMTKLVKADTSYDSFHQILPGENVYDGFVSWLKSTSKNEIEDIEKKCRWFRQVLYVEIYHSYRVWYGEDPYVDDLDNGLREYLKTTYPGYFKRIKSFEKKRFSRRKRFIQSK